MISIDTLWTFLVTPAYVVVFFGTLIDATGTPFLRALALHRGGRSGGYRWRQPGPADRARRHGSGPGHYVVCAAIGAILCARYGCS